MVGIGQKMVKEMVEKWLKLARNGIAEQNKRSAMLNG